jgi:Uma2 family endonuclease
MITSIEQLDPNATYSYADYLTWKFEGYVELLKGKISQMAAPSRNHQRLVLSIGALLHQHLEKSRCQAFVAPFDVRLLDQKKIEASNKNIYTVVQPDVCVVCDESKLDDKGCIGSPDLMIEILSPSTKKKDLEDKYELYEFNGVREYWIVSVNDETITIFDLNEQGKYQLRKIYADEESIIASTTVEGFTVKMERIFSAIK